MGKAAVSFIENYLLFYILILFFVKIFTLAISYFYQCVDKLNNCKIIGFWFTKNFMCFLIKCFKIIVFT